jgi:Flp pilus assembly pilin Flp
MLCDAKLCMECWDATVAIEYAVIAGQIALSIVTALTVLGPTLNDVFFTTIAGMIVGAAP